MNIKIITNDPTKQLEDHRQNVYKIHTKEQEYARNKVEDSSLQNDPSEEETIRNNVSEVVTSTQINEEHKKNLSNPNERYNPVKVKFVEKDKVKHIEEGIIGTVKFVGKDKIAVVWEDGSRERFANSELNQLAYVDNVEKQVSPLTNQMGGTDLNIKPIQQMDEQEIITINERKDLSTPEPKSKLDELFEKAFDEMEDGFNDIEDANPNKEKEKMLERKINSLEKKLEDNKIENIKNKAIDEIISLMKTKGMIKDIESENNQKKLIFEMDDVAFESYKQAILGNPSKTKVVEKTDAEKALESIRNGTFKSQNPGTLVESNDDYEDAISRDLQSVKSASKSEDKLNFEGFKDLQGLTKPVFVENKQVNPLTDMKSAISGLEWTILSKM